MEPRRPIRLRRAGLLALAVGLAGSLAASGVALADALTPESGGSPNADRIDDLYKFAFALGVIVFVGVQGALLYSIIKFRARRGAVAQQIRGNTNLEIGWTVGAAAIIVVLIVATFAQLNGIKNPERSDARGLAATGSVDSRGPLFAQYDQPDPPGGKRLTIDVNGQQYLWRFTYPNKAYSYQTMVVPVDTTVTLNIRAQDVIHSWWIPKLGPKFDATPGYTNHTWFKIPKPGNYIGACAELCGRNHANMVARVKAVPVEEYEAWVSRQRRLIEQANRAAVAERRAESPTKNEGTEKTP